jgi:hypothetical protein
MTACSIREVWLARLILQAHQDGPDADGIKRQVMTDLG